MNRESLIILGVKSFDAMHEECHGYLLADGERTTLIECHPNSLRALARRGIPCHSIDAVYISHWHWDHWGGLVGFLEAIAFEEYYGIGVPESPIAIYLPDLAGIEYQILLKSFGYLAGPRVNFFLNSKFGELLTNHNPPANVACFETKSGKRVVYIPDNFGASEDLARFAAGCDILILVSGGAQSRYEEMRSYMFNATENTLFYVEKSKPRRVVLAHLFFQEDYKEYIDRLNGIDVYFEAGQEILI